MSIDSILHLVADAEHQMWKEFLPVILMVVDEASYNLFDDCNVSLRQTVCPLRTSGGESQFGTEATPEGCPEIGGHQSIVVT